MSLSIISRNGVRCLRKVASFAYQPGEKQAYLFANKQTSSLYEMSYMVNSTNRSFLSGSAAVSSIPKPTLTEDSKVQVTLNPFELVSADLQNISQKMLDQVKNEVPMLSTAAEYFFRNANQGKRIRPTFLLLLSHSLGVAPNTADSSAEVDAARVASQSQKQMGVAEIAEMIHVASLLHDDVLDDSNTRRGIGSVNAVMGNKMAILAGDFLLARASVRLAELGSCDAVWLVATMLDNLVKGEVMQASRDPECLTSFDSYIQKSFYKTASLFAHSAKAVAVVGEHPEEICHLAYKVGHHLGLAFQIIDDVKDFTTSSMILGKPTLNDLRNGLATAPVLYAAEEFPGLHPLINRRFKNSGDVEQASTWVFQSRGIERTRHLAEEHVAIATQAIRDMPEPTTLYGKQCQEALIQICENALKLDKK